MSSDAAPPPGKKARIEPVPEPDPEDRRVDDFETPGTSHSPESPSYSPAEAKVAAEAAAEPEPEPEPREGSHMLYIGRVDYTCDSPLEPFRDMITEFHIDADGKDEEGCITGITTGIENDLESPRWGQPTDGVNIYFSTPEAAQNALDMVAGRVNAKGQVYYTRLGYTGPATKRVRELMNVYLRWESEDYYFVVIRGGVYIICFEVYSGFLDKFKAAPNSGVENEFYAGKLDDARLQECLAVMKWMGLVFL